MLFWSTLYALDVNWTNKRRSEDAYDDMSIYILWSGGTNLDNRYHNSRLKIVSLGTLLCKNGDR